MPRTKQKMAKFHTLKVAEVRRETAEAVSIAFDIPEAVKPEYTYIQGQYITLKIQLNGEEVRRSYSVCSSPLVNEPLRVAVKQVKDGRMSTYLNTQLKAGDMLEVMTPMGSFHSAMNAANKKNYVLFAGGSGITPMLSIIKTVLIAEPQSTLVLLYGNRDEASIIFKTELEKIVADNKSRVKMVHVLEHSQEAEGSLFRGIMLPEKVKALIENYVGFNLDNEFFICGPGPMMRNVESTLLELKIAKERIHLEYFTVDAGAAPAQPAPEIAELESSVTVIMDGEETTFELSSKGKSVLDAAMDAGVDVPFSCKGAVCCTCKAKVLEGKVQMDKNFALTDKEVEEGFILTCQAHPLTEKVLVDYDVV
ncbi:MAG: 1,2-phenylacetyl-CoA epoxidase, subunit E [Bacteroidia bacterium]|nr:1,2-phenylacetyl-CoA epoxidase, subunit E [Bacteroidia bacterium]